MLDSEINEECGVFAVHNSNDANVQCIAGLHALQHRGQDSFGIVTFDGNVFHKYHAYGYVNNLFSNEQEIVKLLGNSAIGHVRYSTSGGKLGMQPIFSKCKFGEVAVAHNGNLINTQELRDILIKKNCTFISDIDTEVIAHLIAVSTKQTFLDCVIDALQQVKGAYSLVIIHKSGIIGVRDPAGIRPLVLGILNNSYILASETCALDIIGAQLVREISPGELITISNEGTNSYSPFKANKSSFCIFEYVYFARPDSVMDGKSVYDTRKKMGFEMAKHSPPESNTHLVVPVPDSGVPAAIGYAEATGIPFEFGIIRNHYIGRTFIQPTDQVRSLGVKLKHNANKAILKGKNIILIDDSLVRGTTLKNIVSLLRDAGVNKIHLKISSPPTAFSCFYGIDTPEQDKLMASKFTQEQMLAALNIDSIYFLTIDSLYKAVCDAERNTNAPQYCDACFTGSYPIGKTIK